MDTNTSAPIAPIRPPIEKQVLDNGIVLYTNVFNDMNPMDIINKCAVICDKYDIKYSEAPINNKEYNTDIRSCTVFSLGAMYDNKELQKEIKQLQFTMDKYINKCVFDYIKANSIIIKQREQYDIIKYEIDQKLSWHKDEGEHHPCIISFVFYFNDDYTGGELQFQTHINGQPFKPPANSLIIFPSSGEYMHQVLPVISGTKHSAISFAK